jgi:hypothetical protein
MKIKAFSCLLFYLLILTLSIHSQAKVSGPECVVPGTEYQYDFYSSADQQSQVEVCVEGGWLVKDNDTCYKGKVLSYVRVIWKEGITKGKISFTTVTGSGSLNVRSATAIQGGKIESTSKLQYIQQAKVPQTITCSESKGGNCFPAFVYQWEQSDDNLHWTEIDEAVHKNLSFSSSLDHTVFFRRRSFDASSNSIIYSDVAIVAVNRLSPRTN